MKTTVEIDEQKLKKVMRLTGIKTRRKAIDYALEQAVRMTEVLEAFEGDFFIDKSSDVIDSSYDLKRVRSEDNPASRGSRGRSH